MQFETKLTLDGIMTLIAGVIAFLAVIIQIRSSSRQLKDQLDAQRIADLEGQQRQKESVARAILFEIDSFYRYYLQDLPGGLKKLDPQSSKLIGMKAIRPESFPVYNGNAHRLGELEADMVAAIVQFYAFAGAFISTVAEYKASSEHYYAGQNVVVSEEKARVFLGQLKNATQELVDAAANACRQLCKFTKVEYSTPRIAVAPEVPAKS